MLTINVITKNDLDWVTVSGTSHINWVYEWGGYWSIGQADISSYLFILVINMVLWNFDETNMIKHSLMALSLCLLTWIFTATRCCYFNAPHCKFICKFANKWVSVLLNQTGTNHWCAHKHANFRTFSETFVHLII